MGSASSTVSSSVLELLDDPEVVHFVEEQERKPIDASDLVELSDARDVVSAFRGILNGEFKERSDPLQRKVERDLIVNTAKVDLTDEELFANLSDSDDETMVASPTPMSPTSNASTSAAGSPRDPRGSLSFASSVETPLATIDGTPMQSNISSDRQTAGGRPSIRKLTRQGSMEYLEEINKSAKKIKALRRKLHVLSSRLHTEHDEYEVDGEPMIGGLEDLFKRFDTEGNGMLTMAQLRQVLNKLKIKLSSDELEVLQASFDIDGDGLVNYHEFKSFTMQTEGEELGTLWSRMRRALDKWQLSEDTDMDGAKSHNILHAPDALSPTTKRSFDRSNAFGRLLAQQDSYETFTHASNNVNYEDANTTQSNRVKVTGLKGALDTIAMPLDNKVLEILVKNFGMKSDGVEVSFLDVLRCAANDFDDDHDEEEMVYVNVDKLCHWLCPAITDLKRVKQRVRQFLRGAVNDLQSTSDANLSEHDAAIAIFDTMEDLGATQGDEDDIKGAIDGNSSSGHVTAEQFRRAVAAMGMPISDQEARALVLEFDDDHNGTIEAEEFAAHLLTD